MADLELHPISVIAEPGEQAKPPASSFRDSAPLIYKPIDIGAFAEYKPTGAFVKAEHDVVAASDWGKRLTLIEQDLRNLTQRIADVYASAHTIRGTGSVPSELEIRQELRNHALQIALLQQQINELGRRPRVGPYGRGPDTWG